MTRVTKSVTRLQDTYAIIFTPQVWLLTHEPCLCRMRITCKLVHFQNYKQRKRKMGMRKCVKYVLSMYTIRNARHMQDYGSNKT